MAKIYYKHIVPQMASFFYVDTETDSIEGVLREYRLKDTFSMTRVIHIPQWEDITHNELAKAFIDASVEISETEYKTAEYVMETFIDCSYWFITEDKMPEANKPQETKKEELVIEPVYV